MRKAGHKAMAMNHAILEENLSETMASTPQILGFPVDVPLILLVISLNRFFGIMLEVKYASNEYSTNLRSFGGGFHWQGLDYDSG